MMGAWFVSLSAGGYLSGTLGAWWPRMPHSRFFLLVAGVLLVAALLLREPDFGALVVITAIAMGVLFLGGLNWRIFAVLAMLLPLAFFGVFVALSVWLMAKYGKNGTTAS